MPDEQGNDQVITCPNCDEHSLTLIDYINGRWVCDNCGYEETR